ncbi:MAG TPA: hypothetical protein DIT40_00110 [Alphaproteobacteria bacterium]|nr:hypothetical protein [Alphaproteobacteria bacterium]HBA42703.1 hypothetical protein [Alphaproteobacteria bacterium]HBC53632.1 hypothetical protein [Alphaproteobacteria bacterium]HCO89355.1 hypothetical protein [Alphaproteobacteria bacterium]
MGQQELPPSRNKALIRPPQLSAAGVIALRQQFTLCQPNALCQPDALRKGAVAYAVYPTGKLLIYVKNITGLLDS